MFFDRRKRDDENAGADTKTDLQKTQNFCPGFSEKRTERYWQFYSCSKQNRYKFEKTAFDRRIKYSQNGYQFNVIKRFFYTLNVRALRQAGYSLILFYFVIAKPLNGVL